MACEIIQSRLNEIKESMCKRNLGNVETEKIALIISQSFDITLANEDYTITILEYVLRYNIRIWIVAQHLRYLGMFGNTS